MRVIAIYNMKGGVGKTTTAVNLSYLAAAGGSRTLLWDLDPQAASTFTLRVRPEVERFGRSSVEEEGAWARAIKASDYSNLDLLPADFGYRKLERLLDDVHKPRRTLATLLRNIGRDYDVVFLDCPAGFSLLAEAVFRAADSVLVPTVPTVLSLRTLARMLEWAAKSESTARVSAFFSMVDARKALHRRAREWSADHAELFLTAQIPYASIVEQMAVRRMPLPVFAAREPATAAFAHLWGELRGQLAQQPRTDSAAAWPRMLDAVESLIARLDTAQDAAGRKTHTGAVLENAPRVRARSGARTADPTVVHDFDTEGRDLEGCGCVLQLLEQSGAYFLVAASREADAGHERDIARVQIDSFWARQILSGTLSPIAALEQRVGRSGRIHAMRTAIAARSIVRIDSRFGDANRSTSERVEPNGARLRQPGGDQDGDVVELRGVADEAVESGEHASDQLAGRLP